MTRVVSTPKVPWIFDYSDGEYQLPERTSIPFDNGPVTEPYPVRYVAGNEPWRLKPGETYWDGYHGLAPIKDAKIFGGTGGGNLKQINQDIAASMPSNQSAVVQLDYGIYTIPTLTDHNNNPASPNYIGTLDWSRKIIGFVGMPRIFDSFGQVTQETIIQVPPTMISSFGQNAIDYATSRVAPQLNGITAMYFSNADYIVNGVLINSPKPMFWSGITFDGTFQIPFTTFTTAAQAKFSRNHGTPAPLPWNGISFVRPKPGSIFQFIRLRGFSMAYTSAPPYESGSSQSNYADGLTVRRSELDGRIAAYLDPQRRRAGGGFMQNKEIEITFEDWYEHHTRRSGNAINTNTGRQDENYTYRNVQLHDIANIDTTDVWPSDWGTTSAAGFNGWNVEAMIGTMTIINCRANIAHTHIAWQVPYSGAPGVYPAPDHTVFFIRGFRTDDTLYGGCLRITVGKTPNSSGQSPVWTVIAAVGIEASGYFDVRWNEGDTEKMIGIRDTEWTARQNAFGDAATFYPKERYFTVKY